MSRLEVEQLKIGNHVFDKFREREVLVWGIESNHDQIVVNYANGSGVYTVDLKDVEPIPLTEEWLLKFGFKYYKDGIYQFWSKDVGIFQVMNCSDNNGFGIRIWLNGTFGRTIYFLHDFQNLLFSLHGVELELK